jgi:hypothetical protein
MLFPESIFKLLILSSLLLMSIAAVALIVMLLKDIKTKNLW